MNRRQFAQRIASAALAASTLPTEAAAATESTAPPFPLSIMLWTVFTDLPFEERLAKVAEAGYTNVELVGEYAKWAEADYPKAIAAAKQHGIRFDATAGLHNGVANPAVRDAFLAELKDALTPMKRLSCPAMIILSGNVVPGLSRDDQHASCIEGLKRATALVEGKQIDGQPVRLLLECIDPEENPKYFLTSAAEAIEIVRAVNHPQVQFLYDLFHEQIAEGNLIEKLDNHIDVIGLIHIADVPGRHEPGTGEINFANVYWKLAQLKYRHHVAMEFKPTGDPVASLRKAREMVANSL
ncbi:hydroxypyruvate isomerase family protein [Occallatibacter savannae]|uniref:hydroxypyruvate isomerase family protein n=1 Tax=Occallatibacter savannae TaxID=1002691 RepID=UPI000D696584|nr:TIM barrel protein [Occallatibacter savannae]